MRVLFLTDSLSDLDGVGRYAVRLITALQKEQPGLEVEVLLARKHRPTSRDASPAWAVSVGLPPDYFYYMSPLRFWPSLVLGVLRTWRAARRADLVHAIKDYPHNHVGLIAARMAGVPCVATAHGTYTVQPLLSERHGRRARRTYKALAAMICVSRYTQKKVLSILGPEDLDRARVHVIPNAVSPGHYVEPRAVGEKPWHEAPFSLGIGELKERKGHHLALEAWCRVAGKYPGLRHYIVGKHSHDDYERSLLAIVEKAGLSDRVHFLGNVTEDEKVDLLQRARFFLHAPVTSEEGGFEGFGIVYLEAAASGTPSIGTLDSGAEDAVVDGVSGLLVEQTPEAVAAACERLLGDEALCERMGAEARTHAQNSDWDANAREVLSIYREVLP